MAVNCNQNNITLTKRAGESTDEPGRVYDELACRWLTGESRHHITEKVVLSEERSNKNNMYMLLVVHSRLTIAEIEQR